MSLFKFNINGTSVGYVRNHKCGSETILEYFYQALAGKSLGYDFRYEHLNDLDHYQHIGQMQNFSFYKDELMLCDVRIAVWRNPVQKFLKAFLYQQRKIPMYRDISVEQFFGNFNLYMQMYKNNQDLLNRFTTNTQKLGADRSIYTHVFEYTEIDSELKPFLEDLSGNKIKNTNLHKSKIPHELTAKETELITALVQEDFENKWC